MNINGTETNAFNPANIESAKKGNVYQLRNSLEEAQSNGVAVGHFNISDWVLLQAVFASAQELKVPVIVGVSEGERKFLGVGQVAALVKSLREEQGVPIFLNADHTTLDVVERPHPATKLPSDIRHWRKSDTTSSDGD